MTTPRPIKSFSKAVTDLQAHGYTLKDGAVVDRAVTREGVIADADANALREVGALVAQEQAG